MTKRLTHDEKRAKEDEKVIKLEKKKGWTWHIDDKVSLTVSPWEIVVIYGSVRSYFSKWEDVFNELFMLLTKKHLNNRHRDKVSEIKQAWEKSANEVKQIAVDMQEFIDSEQFRRYVDAEKALERTKRAIKRNKDRGYNTCDIDPDCL